MTGIDGRPILVAGATGRQGAAQSLTPPAGRSRPTPRPAGLARRGVVICQAQGRPCPSSHGVAALGTGRQI